MFAVPDLEGDAEGVEVLFDVGDHFVAGDLTDGFQGFFAIKVGEAVAFVVEDIVGEVDDVVALITVGGELGVAAEGFEVAGIDGGVEEVHLGAGVVDVILAGDFVAGSLEYGGEDAAEDGATGVADVDGAGGVDADEFDHDLFWIRRVNSAVVVVCVQDCVDLALEPPGMEAEVEEAGGSGPDIFDEVVGGDEAGEGFCDVDGGEAGGAGKAKGKAGGEVAVPGVAGPLDFDVGDGLKG